MFYRFLKYVKENEPKRKISLNNFHIHLSEYLREKYHTSEEMIRQFHWSKIGVIGSLKGYFLYLNNKGCKTKIKLIQPRLIPIILNRY